MIKEFNDLKEIEKYYDEKHNVYIFKENNEYIDKITFNFSLDVEADIYASDIYSSNITAKDIDYYALCFAYNNIKCKSIKGRRHNAKHFVLDGKIEVREDE